MMTTSSFFVAGRTPNAVSIARGSPDWFTGRHYDALKPAWWMIQKLKEPGEFTRAYTELVLERLNARQVIADLGEQSILCCWEPVGKPCHRRIVAGWIERETGIVVPELSE